LNKCTINGENGSEYAKKNHPTYTKVHLCVLTGVLFFSDLLGPPAILDRDLCKMFYFWLSATCKKVYNTELGFNNYELSCE